MSMTIAQRKQALRRRAAALPRVDEPELVAQFLALPQLERADTVMLFCGVGRELDTMPILDQLLARGKRAAYPVCLPGRQMEARQVAGPEQLVPGKFGIPAPDETCPVVDKGEIGLALVPCLMCDRAGYRLGYGGGYYDRWLSDFRGFTVCICPGERMVDELPRDSFDVPVDLVLTQDE